MIQIKINNFKLNTAGHEGLPCTLPASVYGTLYASELMPNPYSGDNACQYSEAINSESVFTSEFEVNQLSCSMSNNVLNLHRIDAPCTVILNGAVVTELRGDETDVRINVKNNIHVGKNTLSLSFPKEGGSHGIKDGRLSRLCAGGCSIISYNGDQIYYVHTRREIFDDYVRLHISVDTYDNSGLTRAVATLVSPGGRVFYCGLMNNYGYIDITDPNFWWPSGLGVQNLYKLTVNLYLESEIVDSKDLNLGLVRFEREDTDACKIPSIYVNGVRLYSRGACYLSDDALLPMLDEKRTRNLLLACRDAGFNTVVFRDLSYYPEDHFFNVCDELGLVVWVELKCMPSDADRRDRLLSHVLMSSYHTSFGLIIATGEGREELAGTISQYISQKIIVPLDDLDSELLSCGASLPSPLTVGTFVRGRDVNIFSPKMEFHSTLSDNKELISSQMYRYPTGISDISYVTQMGEARSIAKTVDEVRRARGDVLHTILPRLSDPWGQISDSVIDNRGKWKAQQYVLSDLFAPIRVGAVNQGTRVTFFVSNEQRSEYQGKLTYSVADSSGEVLFRDGFAINIPGTSSSDIMTVDLDEVIGGNEDRCFVSYSISDGMITTSKGVLLFTTPKKFVFLEPEFDVDITGSGTSFTLSISADVFVQGLEMSFRDIDASFDDNYIDITDSSPIRIEFTTDKATAAPLLKRQLVLRSSYDIGRNQ